MVHFAARIDVRVCFGFLSPSILFNNLHTLLFPLRLNFYFIGPCIVIVVMPAAVDESQKPLSLFILL